MDMFFFILPGYWILTLFLIVEVQLNAYTAHQRTAVYLQQATIPRIQGIFQGRNWSGSLIDIDSTWTISLKFHGYDNILGHKPGSEKIEP